MATDLFNFSQNSSSMEDPIASLIAVGQKALQSGAVTPKQAAKNVKKLNPVLKAAGITSDPIDLIRKRNAAAVAAISNTPDGQMPGTTNVQNPVTGNWSNVPDSTFQGTPKASVDAVTPKSGMSNEQKNYSEENRILKEANEKQNKTITELTNEKNKKSGTTSNLFRDPYDLQKQITGYENIDFFKRQNEGIENMQNMLAVEAGRPVDTLSGPLAGLLQSHFGKNVSGFMQGRGVTPQEQAAKILAYQGKIQDDKRDYMAKIMEAAKIKEGSATESIFESIRQKQLDELLERQRKEEEERLKNAQTNTATAEDPSKPSGRTGTMPLPARAYRDVQDKFRKDTAPFNVAIKSADQIENLINQHGPGSKLSKATVETLLARARGEVGNLSYYEQAGNSGARDILSRLEQTLETLNTGELTDSNKREILGLVASYKAAARDAISYYRDIHAQQGATAYESLGLTQDQFKKALPSLDSTKMSQSAAPKKQEEMIKVISPDGKTGSMPKSMFDKAVKEGKNFKRAP